MIFLELIKLIRLSILNNLILRHNDIDKAQRVLNSMGYCAFNFLSEVEKVYSSWQNVFKRVIIPYIINTFRRWVNPIETYQQVGYSRISALNHNSISKRLFFGANMEMVLLFLDLNQDISTLEDFKIKYKKGFLRKKD